MSITTNEVTKRLKAFVKNPVFSSMEREEADEKLFTRELLHCFDIGLHQYSREHKVDKLDDTKGYIDAFIPKKLLVEAKTRGKKLVKAREQAEAYRFGIPIQDQPKYILLHNFAEFELFDLVDDVHHVFSLEELPKKGKLFSFLYSDDRVEIIEENPINREAAYQISRLHAGLVKVGYVGHNLEVFLTRLLFCFFADDTLIFSENGMVNGWLRKSSIDGDDLGSRLQRLFAVLNTPNDKRQKTLNDDLVQFGYVNGGLFSEQIELPDFDSDLRELLIYCSELDWSLISPAIFGSMFQGVLDEKDANQDRKLSRRELGAHYTSEKNILKVINPLFMDGLRERLKSARSKADMFKLHEHIANLKFLDPACGCGNFLVIAYRELRRFEHDLIEKLYGRSLNQQTGLQDTYIKVSINQFYGIEYEDHASEIGKVALYITDHQMNIEAENRFGQTRPTIPLIATPNIVTANALRYDWNELLPAEGCNYVMGNPPFRGKLQQTDDQRTDLSFVCGGLKNFGLLDYVSAWFVKSSEYMFSNKKVQTAFVATNSICQGEQVATLWQPLLKQGMSINFAYRTFQWSNEGKGVAAVHCVIVGFSYSSLEIKHLFSLDAVARKQTKIVCDNINPYLTNAPSVIISSNNYIVSQEVPMMNGSKPSDGGFLLLSKEEKEKLLYEEPLAYKYLRPFLGADEFINRKERWCLWFADADLKQLSSDLESMPLCLERIKNVKLNREASEYQTSVGSHLRPHEFERIRQPKQGHYLIIPSVSSENRKYVPIGFLDSKTITSNLAFTIPNASLYHFGILNSSMHNAWMRTVAGRLKSDYRYSSTIVYNSFPFPYLATERSENNATPQILKSVEIIETKAQAILNARIKYEQEAIENAQKVPSLADLYRVSLIDTYPELTKAHKDLDKAIDAAYGYKDKDDDASRVAFLFDRYNQLKAEPETV